MTKKEVAVKLEKFIKAHKPDEFKSPGSASSLFWDIANPINKSNPLKQEFVNKNSAFHFTYEVERWWRTDKSPLSESDILSSMDTKYVTHNYVQIHVCDHKYHKCFEAKHSDVIEKMFDLSFKYNIIGVAQKPGDLRIWIKESEDRQTNITGEVVEKIAKCLEYQPILTRESPYKPFEQSEGINYRFKIKWL